VKKLLFLSDNFVLKKNHQLQIRAFAKYLESNSTRDAKLVIIGSVRRHDNEDQKRVEQLEHLVQDLGINNEVIIAKNIDNTELKKWLGRATVGIHTMTHEHFGIGVVEFMAAGVIPIAHNSGGPKEDIVVPFKNDTTGFLATTASEYANYIHYVLSHPKEAAKIQKNARRSVDRFSDETFEEKILDTLSQFKLIRDALT